ncbi:unnamed protein product [Prunus armeniaca]
MHALLGARRGSRTRIGSDSKVEFGSAWALNVVASVEGPDSRPESGDRIPLPSKRNFIPAPVPKPVEQSFALSKNGQSRDPSLGYANQAKRIGATDFDGDGDPAVAKKWIERMERIMEVMAVPQNRRVTMVTFFLVRNARHWWESVKRRYRDPSTITWQLFRAAFDNQYYPQAYQDLKMEEFLHLEQGTMTVLEYEKKFNELSKYCVPLVEDENKKCQFFTGGLNASI